MRFADQVCDWLVQLGYTHCFCVAGGNVMHLLDAARTRFTCVPFVHEVGAGIAAEYFNETSEGGRAFALVTAGPGLTNVLTAMSGAFLESRELLVIGGQVKSTDLASGGIRQRGIQEVDGVAMASPVTVAAIRVAEPMSRDKFFMVAERGSRSRKGPVFIEICLDAQAAPASSEMPEAPAGHRPSARAAHPDLTPAQPDAGDLAVLTRWLSDSRRPVLMLGGGLSRAAVRREMPRLGHLGIPVMTTWNGADRIGAEHPLYMGRPNTWGQRYANVLVQQCDLLVVLGGRLGVQQTGFNWREFVPRGRVVQVDIDETELSKGHPHVELAIKAEADAVLSAVVATGAPRTEVAEWLSFCREVRDALPLREESNVHGAGFLCPYDFMDRMSELTAPTDIIIPCSSGGSMTVTMQAFRQRGGQLMVTDKALASMGYGLSGAIGAALATRRRTILFEGDGGFAQNLQELGTVAVQGPDLKIFVFDNDGYASIRMTQRGYFGDARVGSDRESGVGLPEWQRLFGAYGIPVMRLNDRFDESADFAELMDAPGPAAFVVPVDPAQTYYPKIKSRITSTGSMESSPLHLLTPDLPPEIAQRVFRFLDPDRMVAAEGSN